MAKIATFEGHTNSVICVAALPDGNFVSGANDRTLRVWNTNTGKIMRTFNNTFFGKNWI